MIEQLRIEIQGFEQPGEDAESLLPELDGLREDLLQLDVEDVGRPNVGPPPPGARSSALEQVNALLVTLTTAPALLYQVVTVIEQWRGRTSGGPSRTVVLRLGDRHLEISGGNLEQQRLLTAAWLEACTLAGQRGAGDG